MGNGADAPRSVQMRTHTNTEKWVVTDPTRTETVTCMCLILNVLDRQNQKIREHAPQENAMQCGQLENGLRYVL